jgi:multisubunit Na+/H+ antiporter MnhC subunit
MKSPLAIVGIVILALGIIAFALGGFRFTEEKTALKVGDLKVTTEQQRTLPIPPWVSIAAIVLGVGLTGFALTRR